MKRILFTLIGLGIICGCSKKEDIILNIRQTVFQAYFEDNADTKTYLGEGNRLLWNADDRISVFNGMTYNREYKFKGNTGDNGGSFAMVNTDFASGEDIDKNYAYYPYSGETSITSAGVISAILPSIQAYAPDSFGLGANPMAAATQSIDDYDLRFRNICGWLKLQVTGTASIVKIEFMGNNEEPIAGNITVTAEYGNNPIVSVESATENRITLDCTEGVQLSDTPTSFFITVPPMTFTKGFTIKVYDSEGYYTTKTISSSRTITRNVITPMSSFRYTGDQKAENDREALIAFYNATGGDNWTNNTNWCSDKPLSEWYGVQTDYKGSVCWLNLAGNQLTGFIPVEIGQLTDLTWLELNDNQLTGSIPTEIGLLTNLTWLNLANNQLTGSIPTEIGQLTNLTLCLALSGNQLTGSIPAEIGQLTALTYLTLQNNQLSGPIPTEIGQLTNLTSLSLETNLLSGSIPVEICNLTNLTWASLYHNQLTGSIPAEIGQLTALTYLNLSRNQLTGKIPQSLQEFPWWKKQWFYICGGNNFDLSEAIPAPGFFITDVNGQILESSRIYAENKFTVLYQWASWCPYSSAYTPQLIGLYEKYRSSGLEVIGYSDEDASTVQNTISAFGMPWPNFINNYSYDLPEINFYPAVNVVDNTGKIVFNCLSDDRNNLGAFLKEQLGEGESYYESTDYTFDGNVTTLQTSTVGYGVNVILVGDGFTDKDIASGKYDEKMSYAAEHFFDEEPVKSMRNRFNVYSVTAVSKNGVFAEDAETAFGGYFGDGTLVGGDNGKVFQYAKKIPGITDSKLTESIVIVIMNSSRYAGTCFMYYDNAAIAYFPYGSDDTMFGELLNHEAVGHGFGKLLDEYAYTGTIPQSDIDSYLYEKGLGWGMNVDVTNDPATINWSHFLSDSRYAGQVGIYEGALTWEFGAWRPTDYSIMRYNTGGFNAPSREAIYKRIIGLSGGAYSYEDFVAYDAINRTSGASSVRKAQAAKVDAKTFVPLHKPVIIKRAHDQ